MQKIQIFFNVLMAVLMIPPCIAAFQQLHLPNVEHHYWPFILFAIAILGGGALQVAAVMLNRKKPNADESIKDSEAEELKEELSEVYGDCIYEWAKKARKENEPFSADQLVFHLGFSRDRIEKGLAYLESQRVIQPNSFGWQVDPCRQLVSKFQCVWTKK